MKYDGERVTVTEAARLLGMRPQALRDLMVNRQIDIGFVRAGKRNAYGQVRHEYFVYRDKLNRILGKETA